VAAGRIIQSVADRGLEKPEINIMIQAAWNVTVFCRRTKQGTITRVATSLIHVQPKKKNKCSNISHNIVKQKQVLIIMTFRISILLPNG
jgi:hypothetical protein